MDTHATNLEEVTPIEASTPRPDHVLLDVREDDEWAAGHAPDAVHLALSRLHPDRLPPADTYLVICRSGNRSGRVVAALTRGGFRARNVAGGMNAWAADGLPVVRADGRPGTVA
jgi:rhodanese-related sulfurtransferase